MPKNYDHSIDSMEEKFLLAVDAGIKTGLALYDHHVNLCWYRSHNMGSLTSLKRASYNILRSTQNLAYLVIEGGGPITEAWIKEAKKLNITVIQTDAGKWRPNLLYNREQRSGIKAKQTAIIMAQRIISQSCSKSKNTPTHDAAEAILIGLWGCMQTGWLQKLPDLHG